MRKRSNTTKTGRGARRASASSPARAAPSKRSSARAAKPAKAKRSKTAPKRSPAATRPKAARRSRPAAASDKFVEDLMVRGEAAEVNESGTLHPDATHVIVGKTATGRAKVKRARFKLF